MSPTITITAKTPMKANKIFISILICLCVYIITGTEVPVYSYLQAFARTWSNVYSVMS
jgi:hypothetical protein